MIELYHHIGNSLIALQDELKSTISGADNFATIGYKRSYTTFSTVFSDVESSGTKFKNPMQFGASMAVSATAIDFSQGALGLGTPLDIAISGNGLFQVSQSASDFSASSNKVYTRAGRFTRNYSGEYLVDPLDRKLYGFKLNPDGSLQSDVPEAIFVGEEDDIGFIDGGVLVNNFQRRRDQISDGLPEEDLVEQTPLYSVALTDFRNLNGLVLTEGTAYTQTAASGPPYESGTSGQDSYGNILAEKTEGSNVNVAGIALRMNWLNRGFNMVQGVTDDVTKIVQNLIKSLTA